MEINSIGSKFMLFFLNPFISAIESLKNMGCATAKSVLNTPRAELIENADLEEDTVDEVLRVLRAEFEE